MLVRSVSAPIQDLNAVVFSRPTGIGQRSSLLRMVPRVPLLAALWLAVGSLSVWAQGPLAMQVAPSVSPVAGTGTAGFSGDGAAATGAKLSAPNGMVFDAAGNLYFSDTANSRVRRVSMLTGAVSTVVGTTIAGYNGESVTAANAELNHPMGLAIDTAGNLYIADSGNDRVRKLTAATGLVTTITGNGVPGFLGDGALASLASVNHPVGVLVDVTGNVYIADTNNNRIREITATNGNIITIAGSGAAGAGTGSFSGDNGNPIAATLSGPAALVLDPQGDLFIADAGNFRVRAIYAADPVIVTVAGNGSSVSSGDGGDPLSAGFASITGLTAVSGVVDETGIVTVTTTLYITDGAANRIRATTVPGGPITTLAGTGTVGTTGDGGLAAAALLSGPSALGLDHFGNLYVADTGNNRIRKVQLQSPFFFPTESVGMAAGVQNIYLQMYYAASINSIQIPAGPNGVQEFTIGTVTGCAIDGTTNNQVGQVCTIPITFNPAYPGVRNAALQISLTGANYAQFYMGSVSIGLSGTGVGPLAAMTPGTRTVVAGPNLSLPNIGALAAACAVPDSRGDLFLCDDVRPGTSGLVLKIDAVTSALSIVAGTPNLTYDTSDGVTATSAGIFKVKSIAVNSKGDVYIASDNEVRMVSASDGAIYAAVSNYIVADNGGPLGDGGPAVLASTDPSAIALDTAGNLYVADGSYNRIRRVDTGTGIITTVAGSATGGFGGDGGPATLAELAGPAGVAADAAGDVYLADTGNNRVRRVDALTGVITTVAGNGTAGFSGDGGPATAAEISGPHQLWLDIPGNLYIADLGNSRVRRVDAITGKISTILGGNIPFAPSGSTLSNAYGIPDAPNSVALDGAGNLYVADNLNIEDAGNYGEVIKLAATSGTVLYRTPIIPGSYDSADNPQTANLANIGNAPLMLSTPGSGANPTAPTTGFSLDTSTTCPILESTTTPYTLTAGSSCNYAYDFRPVNTSDSTASVTVSDNSINGAQQTIHFLGTPVDNAVTATTLALSVTPVVYNNLGQAAYFNSTFTFTIGVAHVATNATGSVSGTVAISCNGTPLPGATGPVSNGTATVVTTNIPPGNDEFTAVFTPTSNSLDASTSSEYNQYVNQAYPTVDVTHSTVAYDGNPHGVTVTVSPSSVPYTVYYEDDTINYYSTAPPTHAGSYAVSVQIGTSVDYAGTGEYSNALVITPIPASITLTGLNFIYDGNPHSPAIMTNPIGLAYDINYFAFGSTVDGSASPPSAVGAYTVYANISAQTNYAADAHATMIISADTSSVWIVNDDSTVSHLSMTGTVLQTAGKASGTSALGGIAINGAGDAWSVVNGSNSLVEVSPAGTVTGTFMGGGLNAPVAIAVDGLGQEWIVNTNNTLSSFSGTGVAISPPTGYQATTPGQASALNAPRDVAIDATGSVWVVNSGSSTVTRVFGAAAPVVTPTAAAVANSALGSRP